MIVSKSLATPLLTCDLTHDTTPEGGDSYVLSTLGGMVDDSGGSASMGVNERTVAALQQRWEGAGRGSVPEMMAATWVVRAAQMIVARIEDLLRPLNLTMTKYECLIVLHTSRNHALGLSAMAERLGVHPTSITYAVDQLTRAGLVVRIPHPHDRRQKLAKLTDAGYQLVERAMDVLEQARFGMVGLTERQYRELERLLRKAVTAMEVDQPVVEPPPDAAELAAPASNRPRRGSGISVRPRT